MHSYVASSSWCYVGAFGCDLELPETITVELLVPTVLSNQKWTVALLRPRVGALPLKQLGFFHEPNHSESSTTLSIASKFP